MGQIVDPLSDDMMNMLRGIRNIGKDSLDLIPSLGDSFNRMSQIHFERQQLRRDKYRGQMLGGLANIQGKIGGAVGQAINKAISQFQRGERTLGGSKISNAALQGQLNLLRYNLTQANKGNTDVATKDLINSVIADIAKAETAAGEKGYLGLGTESAKIGARGRQIEANNNLDAIQHAITQQIQRAQGAISNPAMSTRLGQIRQNFDTQYGAASTAKEKAKIIKEATEQVNSVTPQGNNAQDSAQLALVQKTVTRMGSVAWQDRIAMRTRMIWARGKAGLFEINHRLMSMTKYLQPMSDAFKKGVGTFSTINDFFNKVGSRQIGIAHERGAYGRTIRGAGLDFSAMMSAIGTGRRAGMDDREVINQVVGLQQELAQARWGEGTLIDRLGRWGLTPFQANGLMKTPDMLYRDYSRFMKTLGSDIEKLQFLNAVGISPDKKEFIENYEEDAKRWDLMKQNPSRMGILENARILDESGFYAQADAATQIELKRRRILNENAWDEGLIPGLKRAISPENWFMPQWTARQQGIREAKSLREMKRLADILEKNRDVIKENNDAIIGMGGKGADLGAFNLSEGWAEASIANFGENSVVHDLRKLYAKEMGTRDRAQIDEAKKQTATGVRILGGVLGIAALLAPLTGGISLAVGGALAGAAVLGTQALANHIENEYWDDGTSKHVNKLRELARTGKSKEFYEYTKEHKLSGLTLEMAKSKRFQEDEDWAGKTTQGAWNMGLMRDVMLATGKKFSTDAVMNYVLDPIYKFQQKLAEKTGTELTREDRVNAAVRVTTGDSLYGVSDELLKQFARFGFNKEDEKNVDRFYIHKSELLKKSKGKKTDAELDKEAWELTEQDRYNELPEKIRNLMEGESEEEEIGSIEELRERLKERFKQVMKVRKQAFKENLAYAKHSGGARTMTKEEVEAVNITEKYRSADEYADAMIKELDQNGGLTGVLAKLKEKTDATEEMNQKTQSAENAAASAKNANTEGGATKTEKDQVVNIAKIEVNQEFNGNVDAQAVEVASADGVREGGNSIAAALVNASDQGHC